MRAGWEAENRATGLRFTAAHQLLARCIDHPDCADDADSPRAGYAVVDPEVMAGSYLVRELAISASRAEAMLTFAADLHFRYPAILQAMLDGLMEERVARGLAAQMSCVHDEHLARIQQQVVDDYLAGVASGTILGEHARNARADDIIGRYDPDGIRARKTDAARRRGVWFRKGQDGMSTMQATLRTDEAAILAEAIDAKVAQDLAAEHAAADHTAAEAAARDEHNGETPDDHPTDEAAPGNSDESDDPDARDDSDDCGGEDDVVYTRAQRRADVLMSFGCGDTTEPRTPSDTDTDTDSGRDSDSDKTSADDASGDDGAGSTGPVGAGPTAPSGGGSALVLRPKVTVITDPAGGTAGVQFARTGEAALQGLLDLLASCDGATIDPVDPTPGAADHPETALTYKPGAQLARRIRLRDGTCRHPGCTITADACDLDHCIPFNHDNPATGGLTVEANLGALCRRHHRFKTFSDWHYAMTDDGTLTLTTPDGRTMTTHPSGPLATYRRQHAQAEDAAWARQQRRHTDPDKPGRRRKTSWATKTPWARRAERRDAAREQERITSHAQADAAKLQAEREAILADILAAYDKAGRRCPDYDLQLKRDRHHQTACKLIGIRYIPSTDPPATTPADNTPHSHSRWWHNNHHTHNPNPDPTDLDPTRLRDQHDDPPPF